MDFEIHRWQKPASPESLEEVATLWNNNASGRHAFHPWTGAALYRLLADGDRLRGDLFMARVGGELAGFAYTGIIEEEGYPRVGTVENLLVATSYQQRGIGTALLQNCLSWLENVRPRVEFLDALGAWPFGYAFNTLADGSERSGIFLNEAGLYRLFRRAGFEPVRRSFVMRVDVGCAPVREKKSGLLYHIERRQGFTWLDRVFRGRQLWDHYLIEPSGRILSRAIFGLMEGETLHEGKPIFSVFGVNTPEQHRNKGYGIMNISGMLQHVKQLGGKEVELHVYTDNEPALRLYRGLGFNQIAETVMMHKRLR